MKNILEYIIEQQLSDNYVDLINYLIQNDILTNKFVEKHIANFLKTELNLTDKEEDIIAKYTTEINTAKDKINTLAENRGLSKKYVNFGKTTVDKELIRILGYKTLKKFTDNIDTEGISFDDFIKNGNNTQSIYSLYDSSLTNKMKELADINNAKDSKTSASIGPFEIMLNFLITGVQHSIDESNSNTNESYNINLNENNNSEDIDAKGDLNFYYNGKHIEIEIKRADSKGGRPCGQLGNILSMDVVDKYLTDFFIKEIQNNSDSNFNENSINDIIKKFTDDFNTAHNYKESDKNYLKPPKHKTLQKIGFFQTEYTTELLLFIVNKYNISVKKFANALCNAVVQQYHCSRIIQTDKDGKSDVIDSVENYISDAVNSYTPKKATYEQKSKILNVIGFLQLYSYSLIEKFDLVCLIDKTSGKYVIFKSSTCTNSDIKCDNMITDINTVTQFISFGAVSSGESRERACRLKLLKK